MELKEGYKQTEVGAVPEDWVCCSVGDMVASGLLEKPLDGNHGNIHPTSGDFVDYGIPFVMANNVQDGRVDLENCSFIRKKQADSLQKGFAQTGDVLLTHKATIGNTAVVGEIPFPYIMLTPQVTYYRVADQSRLSNLYLRHFFDTSTFQEVLNIRAGGGTRSYIGITSQRQLPVALPPTKAEQEGIAEALSDADALIESLEQLIAKKRQIKQGAMQELLTGNRRLPGFSGDWEEKTLGDVCRITTGRKDVNEGNSDGQFPFFTCSRSHTFSDSYSFDTEAILIAGNGDVGNLHYFKGKFEAYQRTYVLSDFSENVLYLWQQLSAYLAESLGLGKIGSSIPYIKKENLIDFTFRNPADPEEQTAIATILSDMDAEIAALETKHAKARQVKQGMMQELLTGNIRLI